MTKTAAPDTAAAPAAASTTPVGTPPGGGRWTWADGQWQPLPEVDAAPAPAAAPINKAED
jgi:hypothetical protein